MIFGFDHLRGRDRKLRVDAVVIGSGAGGASAARELAARGATVIVLEAGSFVPPSDCTQLEHEMFPRLYHDAAGRTTRDRAVHVHQGKGVGGSTLHNLCLCARIPPAVLEHWREGGFPLSTTTMNALYDEVETLHSVSTMGEGDLNANSRILRDGCERLGWRGGYLRHNRVGCVRSGFCELGCAADAKVNALRAGIVPAVERGATVLADTWARRLRWQDRRVIGVQAAVREPVGGKVAAYVEIETRIVVVSASAPGTAALLLRSGVPDPRHLLGSRLHLHPGVAVAAEFSDPLHSWLGIPQGYECTEFLDFGQRRTWIVPAFAHPAGVSSIFGAFGPEHGRWLSRYPNLAALSVMVHDETSGKSRPDGDFGVSLDYELGLGDLDQLAKGIRAATRLLLAAGAKRVIVPLVRPIVVESEADLDPRLGGLRLRPHDLDITSVHPMSGTWMGTDPFRSCTDADGRYHHLDNLFVADTSLFPGSLGVPPQLTTYALGTHVGRAAAARATP